MVTIQDIYVAVRDAKDYQGRYWENVARVTGTDPEDPTFKALIKSMKVSGYLKVREDQFSIGPTALLDATGQAFVPARRPRPDLTTPHKDRLRVGRRMRLWDNEEPTGSDYLGDRLGETLACLVGVRTSGDPTVRVGIGIGYEDKSAWAGANGGSTVVLRPDDVDALDRAVEDVIAAAEVAAVPYNKSIRRGRMADKELMRLDAARVGLHRAVQRKDADFNLREALKRQGDDFGAEQLEPYVNSLSPQARAEYDELEQQYLLFCRPTGGRDVFAECARGRDLARARQASLITDLTVPEAQEMLAIRSVHWMSRTRAQRDRMDELWERSGEKQGYLEQRWLGRMLHLVEGESRIDGYQECIDDIEAKAPPVTEEQQALIDAARAEMSAADEEYFAMAGNQIASVEVPGGWGTIVLEVDQGEEEEPHRFRVGVRPASWPAGKEWSLGQTTEPWQPGATQLRQLVRAARQQVEQARPVGWRRAPSGVPDV